MDTMISGRSSRVNRDSRQPIKNAEPVDLVQDIMTADDDRHAKFHSDSPWKFGDMTEIS